MLFRSFDARVLISCGVKSSKDLAGLDSLVLAKRIQHFLGTDAGRALRRTAERGELGRLKQWLKSIFEQRGIETDLSEAPKDFDWNAIQKKSKPRPSVPISIKTQSNSSWQFHLELGNAVEDAPTIGAKMAEKLSAIQVTTVGDLLAADPTEVAEALSEKGVTSATVETWQNQAMLVCRIPNLRGQDAQLLVAAGYSSAEHVAATDADHLHEAIQGVARSKQGQRFLRGGNPPDRERIQSWIEWSKHSRAVKAA